MKVIVAGSRDFNDIKLLTTELDNLKLLSDNNDKPITEIVSGTARGADTLGELWATRNNVKITKFPAEWDKYGKSAGYIRNELMAQYSDILYAFWDGTSKGTEHMIKLAKKHDLKIRVIKVLGK